MPSTLPSSFASAAAGNNSHNSDTSSTRNSLRPEGTGFGEWSRRPNGATQTFRRSSLITNSTNTPTPRDVPPSTSSSHVSNTGAYIPPHVTASRNGNSIDTRYSKSQLLDIFRVQQESGDLSDGLSDLFVGEPDLNLSNGMASTRWARREEHLADASGPEVCWDQDGNSIPLSLVELTEEDKVIFSTSVNSPLKPPNSSMTKEGVQRDGPQARKTSMSQGSGPSIYGLTSPSTAKPGSRRRETSESYPFPRDALASPPLTGKSNREESSTTTTASTLARKRLDFKEGGEFVGDDDEDKSHSFGIPSNPPFGHLKRALTGPVNASQTETASPWSNAPQSAGLASMGAFGSFAIGGGSGNTPATSDKRSGLATRGESRYRGLMGRDTANDSSSAVKSKASMGSLNKVEENESKGDSPGGMPNASYRPKNNETDPFPETDLPFGSAALGGGYDMSPSQALRNSEFGTPVRQRFQEDHGFAAFGMTSEMRPYPEHLDRRGIDQFSSHAFPTQQQLGGGATDEPMSPTFTNPYQSPEQATINYDDNDSKRSGMQNVHLPGLGGLGGQAGTNTFAGVGSGSSYESRPAERTQPSTAGPARGFPSLSGLGTLAGLGGTGPWSSIPSGTGRDRAPFGESFVDPLLRSPADLQSPSIARLGPSSATGSSSQGTRGSRMGSLFPQAMQDQMRGSEYPRQSQDDTFGELDDRSESPPVQTDFHPFTTGHSGPGTQMGANDEFFSSSEKSRDLRDASSFKTDISILGLNKSYSPASAQGQSQTSTSQSAFNSQQTPASIALPGQRHPPSIGSPSSNPLPAAQQKTMVMPDRIRWIYRDPQGNTQGPWSGLEMHDWYKAGFFLPELLVKKVEDPDYEPLAQLIRRIGNSREPFLVPQIGIPGPPSTQSGSNWPAQAPAVAGGSAPGSVAQPPFASSFPSFGTTLTAEQQNALERRKQEEQYLMARQKEHLAQQQVLVKQMQLQGAHPMHSQQLHHHSSAHSLHSQPSHGSITSPNGYQASSLQGSNHAGPGIPSFFDNSFRPGGQSSLAPTDTLGNIKEEEGTGLFERLTLGSNYAQDVGDAALQRQQQFEDALSDEQRGAATFSGRVDLQREQAEQDMLQRHAQEDGQYQKERLQQFQTFRAEMDDQRYQENTYKDMHLNDQIDQLQSRQPAQNLQPKDINDFSVPPNVQSTKADQLQSTRNLTLTEQVQKAASAKHSASTGPQSAWMKMETGLPQPLPPPQSSSPLPAPAAQRNRQHVADALTAESLSQAASSSGEAPSASLAPWAKEPAEGLKQPSLKEIQEAEAKKAAKLEEIASAARRAALERELSVQPVAPAPGLPSTSTWGNNESPSTPSASAASAWAKPLPGKSTGSSAPSSKKTLQQIQQEEEAFARKKKAATNNGTAASATTNASQASSSGKRYADLAGKAAMPPVATGGAWTTVGASGKAKPVLPTGPSAGVRSASGNSVPATVPTGRAKPTLTTTRSSSLVTAQQNAQEEFKKWAVTELRPDLSKGIHVEDFVHSLFSLPPEMEIITEAVHGVSQTMDSRHFAEEFIRRRKLADKGMVDSFTSSGSPSNQSSEAKSGGWSEVAKKGPPAPQKDEGSTFKVVAAKKKAAKK